MSRFWVFSDITRFIIKVRFLDFAQTVNIFKLKLNIYQLAGFSLDCWVTCVWTILGNGKYDWSKKGCGSLVLFQYPHSTWTFWRKLCRNSNCPFYFLKYFWGFGQSVQCVDWCQSKLLEGWKLLSLGRFAWWQWAPPARDYPMSRQRITPFTRYHRYTPPPSYQPIRWALQLTLHTSYKQADTDIQSTIHPASLPFNPDTI